MDTFRVEDMQKLVKSHENLCLSIYFPTFPFEDKTKQNPVLLRDMARLAEEELIRAGIAPTEAKLLTDEIEVLADDTEFWLYSCDALALFLAKDEFFVYRLPIHVNSKIQVSHYYYTLPLFELLLDKDYYLFTVDEAGVRFYLGNRFGLTDLTSEDLRKLSISDIHQLYTVEEIQSFRTENRSNRSKGHENVIYHGHGNTKDDRKLRMKEFFQSVVNALPKSLSEGETPVILAGNEEDVSYFRLVYPYHHLLDEELIGDTQLMKTDELHRESWKIIQNLLEQEKAAAKEKYFNLKSIKQVSNQLRNIVRGAFYDRIDTLFVNVNKHDYGSFDDFEDKLTLFLKPQSGDEDLANLSAIQTFNHGGSVYLFGMGEMPDKTTLNAIFRY